MIDCINCILRGTQQWSGEDHVIRAHMRGEHTYKHWNISVRGALYDIFPTVLNLRHMSHVSNACCRTSSPTRARLRRVHARTGARGKRV